jgi:hypothetical protein
MIVWTDGLHIKLNVLTHQCHRTLIVIFFRFGIKCVTCEYINMLQLRIKCRFNVPTFSGILYLVNEFSGPS